MTYLTAIERTHDNPLTGSAQYRVVKCLEYEPYPVWVKVNKVAKMLDGWWALETSSPYRTGTFINPKKALGLC